MLNTTEIMIHIILEKKIIVRDSGDNKENKARTMRKRKHNESLDKISQGLIIKQKNEKNCSKKNSKSFFQKQNQKKKKIKVETKTK